MANETYRRTDAHLEAELTAKIGSADLRRVLIDAVCDRFLERSEACKSTTAAENCGTPS
jgi:phage tail protein X